MLFESLHNGCSVRARARLIMRLRVIVRVGVRGRSRAMVIMRGSYRARRGDSWG